MLDRVVEVFAVYGAVTLILLLIAQFSKYGGSIRTDFHSVMIGWTLMTFIPGVIYILLGFLPGQ